MQYVNHYLTLIQDNKKINLQELAHKTGEPFYIYDLDGLAQRYSDFKKRVDFADVYFSVKSNNNPKVIQTLLKQGAGLDIVSKGEMNLGLNLNCSANRMVFSGVGKTKDELEQALQAQIFQINVESLEELERLGQICSSLNLSAPVAFRINPNIALDTHAYIQTGESGHKFGIEEKFLPHFIEIIKKYSPRLKFQGLAMHIGSQGLSVEPILQSAQLTKNVYERLNREGFHLTTLDLGGGIGIDYRTNNLNEDLERIEFYGSQLKKIFLNFEGKILCEPGRILIGRYGWLVGEVQYIKQTSRVLFAILNTGIHHLIRPALYQSYHRVLPLKQSTEEKKVYTLAGPICESTDVLARDRLLPKLNSGDFLAFCDTGAYASVMNLQYNMHSPAKELAFSKGLLIS